MAAAFADGGQRNEVREYGKIAATPAAMKVLPALSASSTDRMSLLYACPDGTEGTRTAVLQTCTGRQATHRGHYRHCPGTGRP